MNEYVIVHKVITERYVMFSAPSLYDAHLIAVTKYDELHWGETCSSDNWEITETLIKKGASIGANATIICGITVGVYALIGAGSVVNKNVLPYTLMVGNPAKLIGYVCECGHRLDENMKCSKCEKIIEVSDNG